MSLRFLVKKFTALHQKYDKLYFLFVKRKIKFCIQKYNAEEVVVVIFLLKRKYITLHKNFAAENILPEEYINYTYDSSQ